MPRSKSLLLLALAFAALVVVLSLFRAALLNRQEDDFWTNEDCPPGASDGSGEC